MDLEFLCSRLVGSQGGSLMLGYCSVLLVKDIVSGGRLEFLVAQVDSLHNDLGRLQVKDVTDVESRVHFPPRDARIR